MIDDGLSTGAFWANADNGPALIVTACYHWGMTAPENRASRRRRPSPDALAVPSPLMRGSVGPVFGSSDVEPTHERGALQGPAVESMRTAVLLPEESLAAPTASSRR